MPRIRALTQRVTMANVPGAFSIRPKKRTRSILLPPIFKSSLSKVSFTPAQIAENAREFINTLIKLKPATAKGTYLKSIFLSSTMSPGVKIDPKSMEA